MVFDLPERSKPGGFGLNPCFGCQLETNLGQVGDHALLAELRIGRELSRPNIAATIGEAGIDGLNRRVFLLVASHPAEVGIARDFVAQVISAGAEINAFAGDEQKRSSDAPGMSQAAQ
jgi:hypothetical protein